MKIGLKTMLYFIIALYGLTCVLLYHFMIDDKASEYIYLTKKQNRYKSGKLLEKERERRKDEPFMKHQERLHKDKEYQDKSGSYQREKKVNSTLKHQKLYIKIKDKPSNMKVDQSRLKLVDTGDTGDILSNSDVAGGQFTLDIGEFQTLVSSSCTSTKTWPLIPLLPGVFLNTSDEGDRDCTVPRFSQRPLPQTALASFPGCGNTWSRHLIQQLSGVWTGSLYNDPDLGKGGFNAEGVHDSRVSVIKTHWPYVKPNATAVERYPRTVLVVRSPQECLLAEYHRRYSSKHTGLAPDELFNTTQWNYYVKGQVRYWFSFYQTWLKKNTCTLVLDFHQLKSDLSAELRQLALFLGIRGEKLEDNIKCILKHSQGKFKRKGEKKLSVFSNEQKKEVQYYGNLLSDLLEKKTNYRPVFSW